jgi:hypothetical protein
MAVFSKKNIFYIVVLLLPLLYNFCSYCSDSDSNSDDELAGIWGLVSDNKKGITSNLSGRISAITVPVEASEKNASGLSKYSQLSFLSTPTSVAKIPMRQVKHSDFWKTKRMLPIISRFQEDFEQKGITQDPNYAFKMLCNCDKRFEQVLANHKAKNMSDEDIISICYHMNKVFYKQVETGERVNSIATLPLIRFIHEKKNLNSIYNSTLSDEQLAMFR